MAINTAPVSETKPFLGCEPLGGQGPLRVGIVSDFLEENWPSMDLMSEMLLRQFQDFDPNSISASRLRPELRWRMARIPGIGGKGIMKNADRLLNRFSDYPRWLRARARGYDLFHVVDHSYSQLIHVLPRGRTVVTCHDLDTFRCLLEPAQEPRPRWFRSMARRILDGFREADHVICNSRATRESLLRYRLFPPERLTVIHVGVHPAFTSQSNSGTDAEAARLLGPASPGEVRLLSVGSTIPRKRIDILLRVFAAVRAEFPGARLIRVGGAFTEPQLQLARDLGVLEFISVLPFVNSDILAAIYRQVALLLQPSESEGFGMPVTEALASGCPVLASDIASLREVGAPVCEYCPVGDVAAWAAAAARILRANANSDQLASWRHRAAKHAAQYSWLENARRTVQVYAQVVSRGAHESAPGSSSRKES